MLGDPDESIPINDVLHAAIPDVDLVGGPALRGKVLEVRRVIGPGDEEAHIHAVGPTGATKIVEGLPTHRPGDTEVAQVTEVAAGGLKVPIEVRHQDVGGAVIVIDDRHQHAGLPQPGLEITEKSKLATATAV